MSLLAAPVRARAQRPLPPITKAPETPDAPDNAPGDVSDAALIPPRGRAGRPLGIEPARVRARPDLERFRENFVRGMIERNLTASDVARLLWGEKRNPKGAMVAKGRDRITGYLTGQVYPNEANLAKLCEILGKTREQLAIDTSKSRPFRTYVPQTVAPESETPPEPETRPGLETPGKLLYEVTRPGVVRIVYEQHLPEAVAFRVLSEIRRITIEERDEKPEDRSGADGDQ